MLPFSVFAGTSTGLRVARVTSEDEQPSSMAPPPGGFGLCVKFIRNRKAQGYIGAELVNVVGAMCQPAVKSGVAMHAYNDACQDIQTITMRYAGDTDFNVNSLCKEVMAKF